MSLPTVAIIGAGRVGGSLGFLLARAGYPVAAVACRSLAAARRAAAFIGAGAPSTDCIQAASSADVVFITTPDRAIQEVCNTIAAGGGFRKDSLVVHTSGAHTLDLLDGARKAGASRAVIHPLQSVPSREQGIHNLAGSYFRIEADPEARERAKAIVDALGGRELVMPKWAPNPQSAALYHAGAVAVSNYFIALVDYGLAFYEALGADKKEALQAVLPLIRGTLRNMESLGIPAALTGPIARGDVDTVRGHLDAMRERAPELLGLYRELARHTISLAGEKGDCAPDAIEAMLNLVNDKGK